MESTVAPLGRPTRGRLLSRHRRLLHRRITINRRGSVLLFSLFLGGMLAALSVVMLTESATGQRASLLSLDLARAFHLSEAAVDEAICTLRTDPDYRGVSDVALGSVGGRYTVEVTPDGPTRRIVRATGSSPMSASSAVGFVSRNVETVVEVTEAAGPGYGIVGDHSIRVEGLGGQGANVDSYDSRQGPYSPQAARANVRLCTNGHEDKVVRLLGRVTIHGDVLIGPGSDPEQAVWITPKRWTAITGSVSVAPLSVPIETVTMPLLPDGGRLVVGGYDVVTWPGGLYRFSAMQVTGQGRLEFTGPAQIYIEQDVHIGGRGIGTAAQRPSDLTLFVTGSRVVIASEADLFARVVAPYATVDIAGPGHVYGSVLGRDVVIHGRGGVHYDEALNLYDVTLNPPHDPHARQVRVLSWRELEP